MPEIQLLRPWWLLALLPWLLLVIAIWRRRTRGGAWERVCDAALRPYVLVSGQGKGGQRLAWIAALSGILAIVALAGPAWERLPQPVYRDEPPLVIALDLSLSMNATDVTPSRLGRALFKVADILRARDAGQAGETALVVFAGEPFTVTPLTDDTDTILAMLPAITTDLMPRPGARTDRALEQALALLEQANRPGDILLITDAVVPDRDRAVAATVRDRGHRLHVMGVGSAEGTPIPLRGGGFLRDRNGSIVLPRVDAPALRELADRGGGRYIEVSLDDRDLDLLQNTLDRRGGPHASEFSDLRSDAWREEGPWLLLPLLPLAALAFRKGYLLLVLILVLPVPRAEAVEWEALWANPDQRASRLFEEGEAAAAAELFEDPRWKGSAAYRAEDYESAEAALAGLGDTESLYNLGNVLARQGRFEEAIASYESVLSSDPTHEDARHNLDLLRQMRQQAPREGEDQSYQPQQDDQTPQTQDSRGDQNSDTDSDAATDQSSGDQQSQAAPDQEKRDSTQGQPGEDEQDAQARAQALAEQMSEESEQAMEQWLRGIPDDPGGLLRRKFYYQSQRRQLPKEDEGEQQW